MEGHFEWKAIPNGSHSELSNPLRRFRWGGAKSVFQASLNDTIRRCWVFQTSLTDTVQWFWLKIRTFWGGLLRLASPPEEFWGGWWRAAPFNQPLRDGLFNQPLRRGSGPFIKIVQITAKKLIRRRRTLFFRLTRPPEGVFPFNATPRGVWAGPVPTPYGGGVRGGKPPRSLSSYMF